MNLRLLLGAFSTGQFTITSIGTAVAMTSGQSPGGAALQGRDPDNNLATLHISLTEWVAWFAFTNPKSASAPRASRS